MWLFVIPELSAYWLSENKAVKVPGSVVDVTLYSSMNIENAQRKISSFVTNESFRQQQFAPTVGKGTHNLHKARFNWI